MHDPIRKVDRQVWRDGRLSEGARQIPEETALALTYNGGTYAVMMGTAGHPRRALSRCARMSAATMRSTSSPERLRKSRFRPVAASCC